MCAHYLKLSSYGVYFPLFSIFHQHSRPTIEYTSALFKFKANSVKQHFFFIYLEQMPAHIMYCTINSNTYIINNNNIKLRKKVWKGNSITNIKRYLWSRYRAEGGHEKLRKSAMIDSWYLVITAKNEGSKARSVAKNANTHQWLSIARYQRRRKVI